MIELECKDCGDKFERSDRHVYYAKKRIQNRQIDFCKKCINKKKKEKNRIIINCDKCNKQIIKVKTQIKNTNFCNKTCSLSYLNIQNIKNKDEINKKRSNKLKKQCKISFCNICNNIIKNKWRKYCCNKCKNIGVYTKEYKNKLSSILTGKTGGLRNGGGYSKVFEYINIHNEKMFLNLSEIEVSKIFDKLNLDWNRNLKGFKYVDINGNNRNYYPDFYIKTYDLYVEYKGFVTPEMTHKMNNAKNNNNLKLLIIYSNDKRYANLGLNLKQIQDDNNILYENIINYNKDQ